MAVATGHRTASLRSRWLFIGKTNMTRKKLDFEKRFEHYGVWADEYRRTEEIRKLEKLIKSLPGGDENLPSTVEELLQSQKYYFANVGNLGLQECLIAINGKQN